MKIVILKNELKNRSQCYTIMVDKIIGRTGKLCRD